jgi:hypothetical protein
MFYGSLQSKELIETAISRRFSRPIPITHHPRQRCRPRFRSGDVLSCQPNSIVPIITLFSSHPVGVRQTCTSPIHAKNRTQSYVTPIKISCPSMNTKFLEQPFCFRMVDHPLKLVKVCPRARLREGLFIMIKLKLDKLAYISMFSISDI